LGEAISDVVVRHHVEERHDLVHVFVDSLPGRRFGGPSLGGMRPNGSADRLVAKQSLANRLPAGELEPRDTNAIPKQRPPSRPPRVPSASRDDHHDDAEPDEPGDHDCNSSNERMTLEVVDGTVSPRTHRRVTTPAARAAISSASTSEMKSRSLAARFSSRAIVA